MPGLSYTTVYANPRDDWSFKSEPDPTRHDRTDFMPRGRVLGGTSSINSMSFLRGTSEDFDGLESLGNGGWSFSEVLPFFEKLETFEVRNAYRRGEDGPQPVARLASPHPLAKAFIDSCVNVGLGYLDDVNSGALAGVGFVQATQRRGSRYSAARSYIWPIQRRSNLKILLNTLVDRIEMDGRKATGLKLLRGGRKIRARAHKGVVLSAGAFGSPQILMRSGIGRAEDLRDHGIEVMADLPGVGQNFQDHAGTSHTAYVKTKTYNVMTAPLERFAIGAQWLLFGTGPASMPVAHVVGSHRFDSGAQKSRLQVLFCPGGFEMSESGPKFLDRPAVAGLTNVHRPYSSGWVKLRSSEPHEQLNIQPNLFSDERDINTLIAGHRLMRKIFQTKPLAEEVLKEIVPGLSVQSDHELADFVRGNAAGVYHPAGTCKMGVDDMSVVDPRLKVRGVDGLFVADASIMPFVVSANLSATCMMIGERLSDWLVRSG
jgi:choline dehydrogenase